MTQVKESVVTPERFASGLTYKQYAERLERNKEKFEYNYQETKLSDEDVKVLRELVARPDGPARVLALGEDWCPDVFRGLAVFGRLADAVGMDLRVFPRDQNLDIMKEFLNKGESESIPTIVFYTRDHQYLCHWIERPALANWERDLYDQARQAGPEVYEKFQQSEVWAGWRQATVQEIKELLLSLYS